MFLKKKTFHAQIRCVWEVFLEFPFVIWYNNNIHLNGA